MSSYSSEEGLGAAVDSAHLRHRPLAVPPELEWVMAMTRGWAAGLAR